MSLKDGRRAIPSGMSGIWRKNPYGLRVTYDFRQPSLVTLYGECSVEGA